MAIKSNENKFQSEEKDDDKTNKIEFIQKHNFFFSLLS